MCQAMSAFHHLSHLILTPTKPVFLPLSSDGERETQRAERTWPGSLTEQGVELAFEPRQALSLLAMQVTAVITNHSNPRPPSTQARNPGSSFFPMVSIKPASSGRFELCTVLESTRTAPSLHDAPGSGLHHLTPGPLPKSPLTALWTSGISPLPAH